MRRVIRCNNLSIAIVVLVACVYSTPAQDKAIPNSKASDEAAILENLKHMQDGWNTKSGALFAKPFAEDADYVIINGVQIQGKTAIETGHQRIFDTIYKDSTVTLTVKQIRFLRSDIALVHTGSHNRIRQGEETREVDGTITLVMVKDKGEWKIAAFQNTEITSGRK